jgi:uncharacterized protein (DUF58 family)
VTTDPAPPRVSVTRLPPPSPVAGRDPRTMVYKELRPRWSAAGALVLAVLAWSVWSGAGSRLSLFLCAAALTLLALDLVWAQVATARAQLEVTANPPEAIVGDTVTFHLAVTGPRQFLRVRLVSFPSAGAPSAADVGVDVSAAGHLAGAATAREVAAELVLEVVSNGVAGLVGCARRRPISLKRPLAVGPRPIRADQPFPELTRTWGEGPSRPAPTGDLVRGVRPYLPGDPLRRVHWRATARADDLVVKEVEDTAAARLILVLDLGGGGMAGERAAGRAAWYAGEALRRAYLLNLVTTERGRTVAGAVRSPSELNRRLAAAALPGHPTIPVDTKDPVLVVTDRGDSWR